ncbi:hypothetical protein BU17DRAFT_68876 [Hysterangium stoloniferum]|nr:hypothetical protein BU17DRAFT_68876 [Hysterangium stoloniferum]
MQTNSPFLLRFLPTTCPVFAIPDIGEYNNLANANTDVDNWLWPEEDKALWRLAGPEWQNFFTKWRGTSECDSLADPSSPKLSLAPIARLSSYPRGLPVAVLVRKCYIEMFHRVWVRALKPPGPKDGGVLITGQPGTGKTLFLYYLLVRLLQQKQIVLFSLGDHELFLFFHDAVYSANPRMHPSPPTPKSSSPDVFIWSLVDISVRQESQWPLLSRHCFPVLTASPDPIQYRTWMKGIMALIVGLPLWTREELSLGLQYQDFYVNFLDLLRQIYPDKDSSQPRMDPIIALAGFPGAGRILQERYPMTIEGPMSPSPEDALNALLDAAIEHFGYAARDVFHGIYHFDTMTEDLKPALQISHLVLQEIIAVLAPGYSVLNSRVSHRILVMHPIPHKYLDADDWTLNFKSDWIGRNMSKQLHIAEDINICQTINMFRKRPQTAALAGWYFEPLAHCRLAAGSTGGFWPLVTMTSNGADPPEVISDPSTPIPNNVKFAQVQRKVVKFQSTTDLPTCFKEHEYYQPVALNFPFFDAFTVDLHPSRHSAILWILQMTMSRSHGGSAVGYQAIRKIVATLKKQLQETPAPSQKKRKITKPEADNKQIVSEPLVEVRYLLISPRAQNDPVQPTKTWRFPNGWNENCKTYDHRGDAYWLEIILTVRVVDIALSLLQTEGYSTLQL